MEAGAGSSSDGGRRRRVRHPGLGSHVRRQCDRPKVTLVADILVRVKKGLSQVSTELQAFPLVFCWKCLLQGAIRNAFLCNSAGKSCAAPVTVTGGRGGGGGTVCHDYRRWSTKIKLVFQIYDLSLHISVVTPQGDKQDDRVIISLLYDEIFALLELPRRTISAPVTRKSTPKA